MTFISQTRNLLYLRLQFNTKIMKKHILFLGSAMLLIAAPSFSQEQTKAQPQLQKKQVEMVKSEQSIDKKQAAQPMRNSVVREENVKSMKAVKLQKTKSTQVREEVKTSK